MNQGWRQLVNEILNTEISIGQEKVLLVAIAQAIFYAVLILLLVQFVKNLLRNRLLPKLGIDILNSEQYSHPFYWAAFIPSGNWSAIDSKQLTGLE